MLNTSTFSIELNPSTFLQDVKRQNRLAFYLSKNHNVSLTKLKVKKDKKIHPICTFDIETKDGLKGGQLFCWSFLLPLQIFENDLDRFEFEVFSGNTYEDLFQLFLQIKERLQKAKYKKKLTVFVHNLTFESRHLCELQRLYNMKIDFLAPNSDTIAQTFSDFQIVFKDSFQFLQTSQEKAEKDFNIPDQFLKSHTDKVKTIFNKEYRHWTKKDKSIVKEHNKNDVIALYYIMKTFQRELMEISGVDVASKYTLASTSIAVLRRFLTTNIQNPFCFYLWNKEKQKKEIQIDKKAYEFVKNSYFGGRTEMFSNKILNDLDSWDINSSYPDSMKKGVFPNGVCFWLYAQNEQDRTILNQTIHSENGIEGVIECKIDCPSLKYPLLPKKMKILHEQKTIFPTGKWVGTYCVPELRKAVELGYKITPIKGFLSFHNEKLFESYIDRLYKLKSENKGAKREIAKRIMNSSYGKFGQKLLQIVSEYSQFFTDKQSCEKWGLEMSNLYAEMGQTVSFQPLKWNDKQYLGCLKSEREYIKPFSNVLIASYVTCYSRLLLYSYIEKVEKLGGIVHYMDSDSLWIDKSFREKFIESNDLGGLKIEHKSDFVYFMGLKKYIYYDSEKQSLAIAFNGFMKDEREKLLNTLSKCIDFTETIHELRKTFLAEISMGIKYLPLKSSIKTGNFLAFREIKKKFKLQDKKRAWNLDGSSEALILKEF